MKIFQHSTGSYDKRAVCQLRATAHYHFCRDSIARVPLNGRNRLDGNRVGWPPFRTFSTNRATRRRRHHHHHRFIPPRLTLRSHQPRNRRTSRPDTDVLVFHFRAATVPGTLWNLETRRGGKIGEAKGKRNNSEDESSCFVFARVFRFISNVTIHVVDYKDRLDHGRMFPRKGGKWKIF